MREKGSSGAPQYKNSLDCVKQVIRQEGVKGLYRGLAASYLGVIETTLHLAMYERMKDFLAKQNAANQYGQPVNQASQGIALSGAAGFSKLLAVLIAYPHEVRLLSIPV
jgi:solute carrier family 25 protein 33/36